MEQTWHLPSLVGCLLGRRDFSQRELARRCEFSVNVISELLAGQRCSPQSLTLLMVKLAEDEAERYGLLCAHLRDEAVRAGADPTHLVIRHVEGADLNSLDLTAEMNAYLGVIAREAETDKSVCLLIESLADVLVQRIALRADMEASKVVPFVNHADHLAAEPQAPYGAEAVKKTAAQRKRSVAPVPKPPIAG